MQKGYGTGDGKGGDKYQPQSGEHLQKQTIAVVKIYFLF